MGEPLGGNKLGTLAVPETADAADFLLSDGMSLQKDKPAPKRSPIRTLGKLCEAYLARMPEGAIETNTRNCIDIHIRHFHRQLGRQLALAEIDQVKLQEYVNKRSKAKGLRGMPLRPDTIKKELATLTGARRSEMMRSRLRDIDLSAKRAVIREKKRVRGQETTRTVPLSPFVLFKLCRQRRRPANNRSLGWPPNRRNAATLVPTKGPLFGTV